jgi:hypothetical protein
MNRNLLLDEELQVAESASNISGESVPYRMVTLGHRINMAIDRRQYEEADRMNQQLMELDQHASQTRLANFAKLLLDDQKVLPERQPNDLSILHSFPPL